MTIIGAPFPFHQFSVTMRQKRGLSEESVSLRFCVGLCWDCRRSMKGWAALQRRLQDPPHMNLLSAKSHGAMGIAATPPQQKWLGLLQWCSAMGLCSRIWGWCQSCPRQWGEVTQDHLSPAPAPPWTELGQDSGQKECSCYPGEVLNHTLVPFVFPQDAWCWPRVTWHTLGKQQKAASNLFKSWSVPQVKPRAPPETPWPCRARGHPVPAVKPSKPLPTLLLHLAGVPVIFFYPLPLGFFCSCLKTLFFVLAEE